MATVAEIELRPNASSDTVDASINQDVARSFAGDNPVSSPGRSSARPARNRGGSAENSVDAGREGGGGDSQGVFLALLGRFSEPARVIGAFRDIFRHRGTRPSFGGETGRVTVRRVEVGLASRARGF